MDGIGLTEGITSIINGTWERTQHGEEVVRLVDGSNPAAVQKKGVPPGSSHAREVLRQILRIF